LDIKSKYHSLDESIILASLREGDMEAFKHIYDTYWPKLYGYVYNRLKSKEAAEEIIQEVFFTLWRKHKALEVTHSLSAYLFTAVKYQLLNYIKAASIRQNYTQHFLRSEKITDNSNEEQVNANDLKKTMDKAVAMLPEKCQQVFRMSRHEQLSIRDIADALHISHKTVENHLTKALRQLRTILGHYLCLAVIFLIK
jgi:RNA polymerase sigma-70 factor (family 1)